MHKGKVLRLSLEEVYGNFQGRKCPSALRRNAAIIAYRRDSGK